ncbi:MAG: metallophosphoesterase [Ignavibacteriaceae bacterium]
MSVIWKYRSQKLSLLLVIFVFFSLTVDSFAQEFHFVVWGDSQFENQKTFDEIVKETELLHPDFVIHVGDMIHGYTYDINTARKQWKKFKEQISPLTVPFYPTPGNHDVTTKEIQPAYTETWGKDKLFYSFNYKNSHFIILNAFLNQDFDTIPPKELEWFKNDLENAKNAENIFISFHSPLYMNPKYDWKPIQELLKKYSIKGVFSGHYHIYDFRVENGIPYFCLNSSGNMDFTNFLAGYGHGFLYVTVNGGKVSYAFISNGKVYPPDAVKAGESRRSPVFFNSDKTIIINDPSKAPVKLETKVPVINRSNITRNYNLTWKTGDYRWKFEPWGANVSVGPGQTKMVKFSISGPKGNFTRDELPKLKISSPYKSLSGNETRSIYYFRLFSPPRTVAKFTGEKIVLDGVPDEKVWQSVKGINQLYSGYTGELAKERTNIKILYNNKNLYVSIVGEEPNPQKLSAVAYGDIPLVFGDDDFELYFDTNHDQTTFYRLMVNPKGTILCSSPKGLFSFKFDVKTHVGKDSWSAEFKIPFSQLNMKEPSRGEIWGFNVIRHRLQSKIQQSFWSLMQYYLPYQPEYFGLLKFE